MSKRISDAELRQMHMAAMAERLLDHPLPAREIVGRLVEEVRRLRGLVARAAPYFPGLDHEMRSQKDAADCRALEADLEAEARAIADEGFATGAAKAQEAPGGSGK